MRSFLSKLGIFFGWICLIGSLGLIFNPTEPEYRARGFIYLIIALILLRKHLKRIFTGNSKVAQQLQKELEEKVLQIKNGNLPIVYPNNVRLKQGETPHFAEFARLMEVKTAGYKSTGGNIRFRVAKGVTIGSAKGRMKADKQLMSVSEGELIITNMRVIFAGNMKSFEYPVDKIINYETLDDGVVLNTSSKSHILRMNNNSPMFFNLIMKQV